MNHYPNDVTIKRWLFILQLFNIRQQFKSKLDFHLTVLTMKVSTIRFLTSHQKGKRLVEVNYGRMLFSQKPTLFVLKREKRTGCVKFLIFYGNKNW